MRSKIITFSLLIATLALGFTRIAQADDYDSLSKVSYKIGEYHVRVNQITNDHFKALITFFDEFENIENFANIKLSERLTAPEESNRASVCTETDQGKMNFSATCLEYKLNRELDALTTSLNKIAERADSSVEIQDLSGLAQSLAMNNDFVTEQINQSIKLQKQTLRFYRQTLFAYPIHIQYEMTKDELNELISNLKNLKRELQLYPSKFHDATTAICT